MKQRAVSIFAFALALLMSFHVAEAQSTSLYFESLYDAAPPGAELRIDLYADSESAVNAFEAILTFDPNLIIFQGFDDSRSIINVWVQRPEESSPGTVQLVGGLRTGFSGTHGLIGTLIFKAMSEGDARIGFTESNAYAADGKGTKFEVMPSEFAIAVREGAVLPTYESASDKNSPEVEFARVVEDPFGGSEHFVAYSVKDAETGIHEVEARTLTWLSWSAWAPAENPVRVEKNVWAIGLRVSDNSGNLAARIVYYWPAFMRTVFPVAALFVCALFALLKFVMRRDKRKRARE